VSRTIVAVPVATNMLHPINVLLLRSIAHIRLYPSLVQPHHVHHFILLAILLSLNSCQAVEWTEDRSSVEGDSTTSGACVSFRVIARCGVCLLHVSRPGLRMRSYP